MVSRDGRYDAGDLVLLGEARGKRGGRVRVVRRLGRPDVARDVIAALLIDRGLTPGFRVLRISKRFAPLCYNKCLSPSSVMSN